jgi:hypothetical protein
MDLLMGTYGSAVLRTVVNAGPRRFTPPIGLATHLISDHGIDPELCGISP